MTLNELKTAHCYEQAIQHAIRYARESLDKCQQGHEGYPFKALHGEATEAQITAALDQIFGALHGTLENMESDSENESERLHKQIAARS